MRDHRDGLIELLALADRLSAEAQTRGGSWVVTHGEPHAANVIQTSEGRVLVDWDTVAIAPPERDLWMLVDRGDPGDLYVRATGRPINDAALDFFRLAWDLGDLAEYLSRAPVAAPGERRHAAAVSGRGELRRDQGELVRAARPGLGEVAAAAHDALAAFDQLGSRAPAALRAGGGRG